MQKSQSSGRLIIPGHTIGPGPIPFTLYTDGGSGSVQLFCKAGLNITDDHLELIARSRRRLFILKADAEDYHGYLVDRLGEILANETLDDAKKITVVHDVGKGLVAKLLSNPRCGDSIRNSEAFIGSMVNVITQASSIDSRLFMLTTNHSYLLPHAVNVSTFCVLIGAQMFGSDAPMLGELALGGLLHDIGMSAINTEIVNKEGPLNRADWLEMRKHPYYSGKILKEHDLSEGVVAMATEHHERLDGSGYPGKLSRKEIHPFALICAVADVYDALTSVRPYRPAMPHIEAIEMMASKRNEFDPDAFHALLRLVLRHEALVARYSRVERATRFNDISIEDILLPVVA